MAVTFASNNPYARILNASPVRKADTGTRPAARAMQGDTTTQAPAPAPIQVGVNHARTNQRNFFALHQRSDSNRETGASIWNANDLPHVPTPVAREGQAPAGARLSGPAEAPHVPMDMGGAPARADARQEYLPRDSSQAVGSAAPENIQAGQPSASATVLGPADIPHIPALMDVTSATVLGPADIHHTPAPMDATAARARMMYNYRPRRSARPARGEGGPAAPSPRSDEEAPRPAMNRENDQLSFNRSIAEADGQDDPSPRYAPRVPEGHGGLPHDMDLVHDVDGRASVPAGAARAPAVEPPPAYMKSPATAVEPPPAKMNYAPVAQRGGTTILNKFSSWRRNRASDRREAKYNRSQQKLAQIRTTPVTHEVRLKANGQPARRIRFQTTGQQIQDFMAWQNSMDSGAATNPVERNRQLIAFLEKQNVPFEMYFRGGSPATMPRGLASQFIANQQQAPALQSVWDQYREMQFLMTKRAPTRQL